MSILNKVSERIHYYLDNMRILKLNATIERFKFDHQDNQILVIYRLGKQKILNKMNIRYFEQEYFENISHYDQYRLTKFTTLQYLLQNLFHDNFCDKRVMVKFIEEKTRQEQLF